MNGFNPYSCQINNQIVQAQCYMENCVTGVSMKLMFPNTVFATDNTLLNLTPQVLDWGMGFSQQLPLSLTPSVPNPLPG